jgi:hypothetical protein
MKLVFMSVLGVSYYDFCLDFPTLTGASSSETRTTPTGTLAQIAFCAQETILSISDGAGGGVGSAGVPVFKETWCP